METTEIKEVMAVTIGMEETEATAAGIQATAAMAGGNGCDVLDVVICMVWVTI